MIKRSICGGLILLALSACTKQSGTSRQAIIDYARTAKPQDHHIAEIYQRSCQTCHAQGLAGAPMVGDERTWTQLLASRSFDGLVENTIQGYRGMPPMGMCMDCDREDFVRLIEFMMQKAHN